MNSERFRLVCVADGEVLSSWPTHEEAATAFNDLNAESETEYRIEDAATCSPAPS